ncbi:MAG TPA: hypothetical protein IAA00_15610 [Candidatus Blautia ornithocaccae]|nr:hypothetical protein [Candidatus Blautia ornithocaccae]
MKICHTGFKIWIHQTIGNPCMGYSHLGMSGHRRSLCGKNLCRIMGHY